MYKFTAVVNSDQKECVALRPQITVQKQCVAQKARNRRFLAVQKECVALSPQITAQSAGGALRMIHIQKMKPEYSEILILEYSETLIF